MLLTLPSVLTTVPAPRSAEVADRPLTPVDLADRRARVEAAVQAAAQAPVRHVPAALLDALQGSWGTPAEVLGTAAAPRQLLVAR